MFAKFKTLIDCEVEIIENFDVSTETVDSTIDCFKKDETFEAELITILDGEYEIQFFDGTVAYLDKEHFEVL